MRLIPGDMALLAIDPQPETDRLAGRDHACPQRAARPALEAQHDRRVVLEFAERHEGLDVGGELLDLESGDEADEMIGMRADIGDDAARPCVLGIGAPGLLDALLFERHRQPAERELGLHDSQTSDRALGDEHARMTHHRVAGIIVGDGEQAIGFRRPLNEIASVFEPGSERLVADHMNAAIEECGGDGVMGGAWASRSSPPRCRRAAIDSASAISR